MSGRPKRKRKNAGSGEMYIHQSTSVATTYEPSTDGRRVNARSTFVDISTPGILDYHAEDVQTAEALEKDDFSYLCGDDGSWDDAGVEGRVPLAGEEKDDDGITMRLGNLSGSPSAETVGVVHLERWENADTPMKVFVQRYRDETLDEMIRGEGRGSPDCYEQCGECKRPDPLFRCARQACVGSGMYCEVCIVNLHRQLPTHMIERWNGEFFTPLMQSDLDVEARIQLGHVPGTFCPRARPAHKDFVIIDVLGIRVVKLNFCGCDSTIEHRQQLMRACLWPATSIDPQTCATFNAIRLFEVQNCLGKISAYDFVRSLELLTNNDGMETVDKKGTPKPPPDRRRAFRAIVRQYRMMQMHKRAGRVHDDSGVSGTRQGELALPCRACPQPGMNLPEGWDQINWDEMDEDQQYKYFTSLSEDANFKLINRNVSTEERDPIVDDGYGYFCNRVDYMEHIRKHVDEEEISSCSGFQAMFLANAKRVKGLRVTGIGGVTCARHNMWRANGIGDLQKGERYCNMHFLFVASLLGFIMSFLVLSYDIACQFSKNVWTRMDSLPEKYRLKINRANVRWMTVEQNWEFVNGIAASTKLMGLGARHTALEGLFGFHNWRRLVAHRRLLTQRMAEGIKDGRVHKEAFKAFNDGLVGSGEVDVESWRVWVDKWEKEQHVENEKGSPYEFEEEGLTLKEIRLLLAAEEYTKTGDDTEVEREDTPSTFLAMGMEIEEAQRQLAVTIKAAGPTPTPTQELEFLRRRASLRVRLQAFRKMQMTYMPRVRHYLTASQKAVWDADNQQPEATRLFMPSDLSSDSARHKACAPGLDGVEKRLREGEAQEALTQLRQGLRTRTMTNRFKIRNWTGQRALTRGQGILRQINIKIHSAKLRYRYARQALLKLRGHGEWEKLYRVLLDEDVRALNDRALREEEEARDEHLGALGVADGLAATGAVAMGEGHRTLSWIWYTASTAEEGDAKLHEALRVEWAKAYSRSNRWREDLVVVEEEMRRTIQFGWFAERQWLERATARTVMLGRSVPIDAAVREGARAYALEQADRERRTSAKLERDWAPIRAKAGAYLKGEDMSGLPNVVVEVDEDQLRWAEARVYAEEEGENDMYQ
ncbi:hypothetical protein B0H13DRAFT_2377113 [Mycena leptocephala]|nr:hypothetical protein B0H13DRAFT_2377113 [Mycena leptocephala]